MTDYADDERTPSFEVLSTGTQILHYRIINRIGAGGMGEVYRAEDTSLGRQVALKFLPSYLCTDDSYKRRFSREARAIAAIEHQNVVTIHEVGEYHSRPFYSMQYLEGHSLRDVLRNSPPSLGEAVDLMVAICDGLVSIHRAGVIHRDIKPSNIALDASGHPKFVDFGLAHVEGQEQFTSAGQALGTIGYMAPEVLRGEPVDDRSDIFSLGVTLYEVTAGKHPFRRDNSGATLQAVLNETPTPLVDIDPKLPHILQCILDRALQKDRDLRYHSAEEMLFDLKHLQRALTADEPLSHATRFVGRSRSLRFLIPILVLSVILLISLNANLRRSVWHVFSSADLPKRPVVAVLPFVDLSADPMSQPLLEGLTETVASKLTQLERYHNSLWVIPSREMREKGITSAAEARKVFGANLAISCATQKLGGLTRLTVSLIDTHSQRQLRSQLLDYQTRNLAEFQDSTVEVVASMLDMHLYPDERRVLERGGTRDGEAYQMYLTAEGWLRGDSKLGYSVDRYDIDSSIAYFQGALDRDANFVLALAGMGEAYWRKYEFDNDSHWEDRAIYFSQRAIIVDDSVGRAHVTLGLIHQGQGKYAEAADEFNLALKLDPSNRFALRRLAASLERLNRTDSAETVYRRAIALRPDNWSGYSELGFFYARRGNTEAAKEQLQLAVATEPEGYIAWNNLGALATLWGDWDTAVEMWERSAAIKPTWGALSNLGSRYLELGQPKLAAEKFRKALDVNPQDYRLWINLGMALNRVSGEDSTAHDALERGIDLGSRQREINPHDPDILRSLAVARANLGDSSGAAENITQAMTLAPDNADIALDAATVFEEIGNRERAQQCIIDALKMDYSLEDVESYWPELKQVITDPKFDSLYHKLK